MIKSSVKISVHLIIEASIEWGKNKCLLPRYFYLFIYLLICPICVLYESFQKGNLITKIDAVILNLINHNFCRCAFFKSREREMRVCLIPWNSIPFG